MRRMIPLLVVCMALTGCDRSKEPRTPEQLLEVLEADISADVTSEELLEGLRARDRVLYGTVLRFLRLSPEKYTAEIGDVLLRDLDDPQWDWHHNSTIRTLGECKETRAVDWLLAQMKRTDFNNDSVISALGEIGDRRALKPIMKDARRRLDGYGNRHIMESSIGSIGKLSEGTDESIPMLLEFSRLKRTEFRIAAARALGRTRRPKAIPRLVEMMKGKDTDDAVVATAALGHIGSDEAVRLLLNQLKPVSARYWNVKEPGGEPKDEHRTLR